jgi:NitT/TauT family transport system substrate-binding protein
MRWSDYTIIIAQERGLFEKYGVEVEALFYESYYDSLPDLAAGQIDGSMPNIGDALNISRHTDLNIVAVYDDGGQNAIVASPFITRVSDLRGKRLGVPLGSPYELLVTQMLETGGLALSDVSLFNYDPSEVPNAMGDYIDAGLTWEPFTSESIQNGDRILFTSNSETMLFPGVIAFRRETVNSRPYDIHAFLKAWFEAVKFRRQNPQASRQIIANYLGVRVDTIELESPVKLLNQSENLELYQPSPDSTESELQQIAAANASFLVRIGTLTDLPDLAAILDGSFLR